MAILGGKKNNFSGLFEALRMYHRGGTAGTGRTDSPPASSTATAKTSSSNAGSDTDSGGREERRSTKKEREKRE